MPQTTLQLTELVKKNYNLSQIMQITGLIEPIVIKFLSDNFIDPDVSKFLLNYYSQYKIDTDRILVISDTHLGRYHDTYKLLESVYTFALRHNIKYVVHAGDIIEGYVNNSIDAKPTIQQLNELMQEYPNTGEIKTYYILGNHDYLFNKDTKNNCYYDEYLVKEYLDMLENFVYVGPLRSYINLNGRFVLIHHSNQYDFRIPSIDYDLRLQGHSHGYNFKGLERQIDLPSLCIESNSFIANAGFIVLSMNQDGYISSKYSFNSYIQPIKTDEKQLLYSKNKH